MQCPAEPPRVGIDPGPMVPYAGGVFTCISKKDQYFKRLERKADLPRTHLGLQSRSGSATPTFLAPISATR